MEAKDCVVGFETSSCLVRLCDRMTSLVEKHSFPVERSTYGFISNKLRSSVTVRDHEESWQSYKYKHISFEQHAELT